MSKVLKIAAIIGAIAVNVIPGAGQALSAAILGGLGVGFAGFAAAAAAVGALGTALTIGITGAGLLSATSLMTPKVGGAGGLPDLERLNLSFYAAAPRKMVLGVTAAATDLRYTEPSGTDQRYVDGIVHLASHKLTSVDEVYINDKLAWTLAGGVQSEFAGYLSITIVLETSASAYLTVNGGANWGALQRMTGCALMKIRVDRQGATKTAVSPFAAGLPSNIRVVVKGMPVYDPRRDSTVPGGSGSHRANDCTTWQWNDGATVLGDNLALQALSWKLGWRVMGKVSVGLGLPASELDLAMFAASANKCDALIDLAGGGTQRRYTGGGVIPDDGNISRFQEAFALATNGYWDDSSGLLGFGIVVNDLSFVPVLLDESDILSKIDWRAFGSIDTQYNIVRGQNPDPDSKSLFQPTDYPEIKITSPDGIDRAFSLNLAMVQDKRMAQRIAKQVLQRFQYQGKLVITVGIRGWLLFYKSPVRVNLPLLGWSEKLFRVELWEPNLDGSVNLLLQEENVAIYAWDREEQASIVAATPIYYDPRNAPGSKLPTWNGLIDDGNKPENGATNSGDYVEHFGNYLDLAGLQTAWVAVAGTMSLHGPDGNMSSGKGLRIVGNNSNIQGLRSIPYSYEDLYEISFRAYIESVGSGNYFYVGFIALDATGAQLNGTTYGSYHYVASYAWPYAAGFHDFVGYVRGRAPALSGNDGRPSSNPSDPGAALNGTVSIRPAILANWGGTGGDTIIDQFSIKKVEDLVPLPSRPWLAGDLQQKGQIVTFGGRSWVARVQNTGVTPPSTSTGTATWALLADKGADGIGVPGDPGDDGVSLYTWIAHANSPDGTIDFTTGAPGSRAWQGIRVNNVSATESTNPADYQWSPYKGPAAFGIVPTNAVVAGNVVIATIAAGWASIGAYSSESYTNGAATSATIGQTNGDIMVGLNSDTVTDPGYYYIDYAWHPASDGNLYIYESGGYVGAYGAYTTSTVLTVQYDGAGIIQYLKDGVVMRKVRNAGPGRTFYFDCAIAGPVGTRLTVLSFVQGSASAAPVAQMVVNGATPLLDVTGNTITKPGAAVSAWDSGAYSSNSFANGAQVTFTVTGALMVGLNRTPASAAGYTDIDFTFYFDGSYTYHDIRIGSSVPGGHAIIASFGAYTTTDVWCVDYDGGSGVVRFYRNGVVVATYNWDLLGQTMFIDSSIVNPLSSFTLLSFTATGATGAGAFTLVNVANTSFLGPNTIAKTSPPNWDGMARTAESFSKGVTTSWRAEPNIGGGLTRPSTLTSSYMSIDYWWHCSSAGNTLSVWRAGMGMVWGPGDTWVAGKILSIVDDNVNVYYYYDGILKYSHAKNAVDEQLCGAYALYNPGNNIAGITFAASGTKGPQGPAGADSTVPGPVGPSGDAWRQVFIRAASTPATPSPSAGTPSGWYGDTGSVPGGSEPMWSSGGARASGASNYIWQAPIRVEAIAGVLTGQSVALGFVTSSIMAFSLSAGQSRIVGAQIALDVPTGFGSAYINIEYREAGGGWTGSNGGTTFYDNGDPGVVEHTITVTNSNMVRVDYEVRATGFRSGVNSGPVTVSRSQLAI